MEHLKGRFNTETLSNSSSDVARAGGEKSENVKFNSFEDLQKCGTGFIQQLRRFGTKCEDLQQSEHTIPQ